MILNFLASDRWILRLYALQCWSERKGGTDTSRALYRLIKNLGDLRDNNRELAELRGVQAERIIRLARLIDEQPEASDA